MGILINTGFDVGSSSPIDNRTLKETTLERDALVSEGKVYENLKVYCKDTQKEYRWTGTEWETVVGSGRDLTDYQKKTDNTLTTTDKTIVGAINEVKDSIITNYKDLTNKPSIEGVELDGNKSLSDLGITIYDDTEVKSDIASLKEQTSDLQEQIDNLNIPDITDLENRVTTNEADITGLQKQIDNLDSSDLTVNDIPKTTLTPEFPGEARVASGGVAIKYVVKNGWCNVNFEFNLASATTFTWTRIASGLPKPANNVNILLTDETGKLNRTIAIKITSTGSVSSRIPVAFTANDWWCGNISYPVAES